MSVFLTKPSRAMSPAHAAGLRRGQIKARKVGYGAVPIVPDEMQLARRGAVLSVPSRAVGFLEEQALDADVKDRGRRHRGANWLLGEDWAEAVLPDTDPHLRGVTKCEGINWSLYDRLRDWNADSDSC
jgi:hypothetical protein